MSILKKLFGGGTPPEPTVETYEGFRIMPQPMKESGGFRLGARIEKDIGGETKVHDLIRADTFQSRDEADAASIRKARQMIDEQGDRLF